MKKAEEEQEEAAAAAAAHTCCGYVNEGLDVLRGVYSHHNDAPSLDGCVVHNQYKARSDALPSVKSLALSENVSCEQTAAE